MTTAAAPFKPRYKLMSPRGDLLADLQNERLVLERLQALLSQWLRMENVTILIGAGASKGQKGPLLNELEVFVLEAMLKMCTDDKGLAALLPVVEERRKVVIPDRTTTLTFEQWLSHLTNTAHIMCADETPVTEITLYGVTGITPEQLTGFLKVLTQVIFVRCSLQLASAKSSSDVSGHHSLVAKLIARDPALGRTSLFTTNYDTLIEQAMDDLGIHYADGFTGTVHRRFSPSCYGLDIYYPGDVAAGRVRRFDKYMHLYKLHGSIHWRRKDGEIIQAFDLKLGAWESWMKLSAAEMRKQLNQWVPLDGDQIGILPTECKFAETLGMPYAHIFRAFHQRLQEPQTFLVVLGYSFGDEHINRIIEDAMSNPSLVMLVIEPFPNDSLKKRLDRYKNMGERAFLLTATTPGPRDQPPIAGFDDFANEIMPNVQWLNDFIALRKTESVLNSSGAVTPSASSTPSAV